MQDFNHYFSDLLLTGTIEELNRFNTILNYIQNIEYKVISKKEWCISEEEQREFLWG